MTVDSGIRLQSIDVPECDAGAPVPAIMMDDNSLAFGYCTAPREAETVCIITVESSSIAKFGAPNDEALHGHRYASIGLKPYDAFEVLNSEWIREIMIANRVHSGHDERLFEKHRHFIFTFHDSTLEFIAWDGFSIRTVRGGVLERTYEAFASLGR